MIGCSYCDLWQEMSSSGVKSWHKSQMIINWSMKFFPASIICLNISFPRLYWLSFGQRHSVICWAGLGVEFLGFSSVAAILFCDKPTFCLQFMVGLWLFPGLAQIASLATSCHKLKSLHFCCKTLRHVWSKVWFYVELRCVISSKLDTICPQNTDQEGDKN